MKGTKVKTGELLKVTWISGYFDNIANAERIEIGYWNGHEYTPLHNDDPDTADIPVFWNGEVLLREDQYVYIKCADVASDEVMKLRANGRYC